MHEIDRNLLLATSRRKIHVFGAAVNGSWQSKTRRECPAGGADPGGSISFGEPLLHCAADVDDVVGDHAEADPALHSNEALVAAAVEPMSALSHTDASLAAGAPFLAVAEPALPLLAFAFGTPG